jgi:hypothetical protein
MELPHSERPSSTESQFNDRVNPNHAFNATVTSILRAGSYRHWLRLIFIAVVFGLLTGCQPGPINTPDEAISAAKSAWHSVHDKASWHAIFSDESVAGSEPYSAVLESGKWRVTGTLRDGVADMPEALINQQDGSAHVFTHLTQP